MLHPLTHILIALSFALIAVSTPVEEGLVVLFFGLGITLAIPRRAETMLARPFLKVLGIALLFLLLIHGVRWSPFGILRTGIFQALESFTRIGSPVVAVLFLSRQIRSEELFAFFLDVKIPPVVILILFRTLWLIPRFTERMDETLIALKLRGMPAETSLQRIRALVPALGTIFASMFAETSDNSLTIAARGFLNPGPKSHLLALRFRVRDGAVMALCLLITGIVWF
jgi:energy-coupling factor transporter transmembrane protein EcfT